MIGEVVGGKGDPKDAHDKNFISTEQAVKSALSSNDAGTNMKTLKNICKARLLRVTRTNLTKLTSFVKTANPQRLISDVPTGVAGA